MNKQQIKIVVGALAGDEGKGLATDYFGSKVEGKILGVLTNGSSQRAHTVDTSDGKHHVFNHFSSATFRGADTYISKYFVVNPIQFVEEYTELQEEFGITPRVYMHPDCKFVTPWDILSNLVELRKTGKYNSTGCGFWKTLERYNNDVHSVNIQEAYNLITFSKSSFDDIKQYYKKDWDLITTPIDIRGLERHFIDDMFFLFHHVIWINDTILNRYENIIFENGQGLLIGEQSEKDWDYCTPSNTGIRYAIEMIQNINSLGFSQKDIEICYVARTYMTRHGQGDVPFLCPKEDINPEMNDQTNTFNVCQGHLRYGLLPVYDMLDNIKKDMIEITTLYFKGLCALNDITISLMMTHWNEYHDESINVLSEAFEKTYLSDGKTAESVKLIGEVIE